MDDEFTVEILILVIPFLHKQTLVIRLIKQYHILSWNEMITTGNLHEL